MIHVGEKKPLTFYINPQPPLPAPANPVSLVGASGAVLYIKNDQSGALANFACSIVSSDPNPMNHYCTYTLAGAEFATPGSYELELVVTYTGGNILKSDIYHIAVGAVLA